MDKLIENGAFLLTDKLIETYGQKDRCYQELTTKR